MSTSLEPSRPLQKDRLAPQGLAIGPLKTHLDAMTPVGTPALRCPAWHGHAEREHDILKRLGEGRTVAVVGRELGMRRTTVERIRELATSRPPDYWADYVLPLTVPPAAAPGQWLDDMISRVRFRGNALEDVAAQMLSRMLATGLTRRDGVPCRAPAHLASTHYSLDTVQHGAMLRRVVAAVLTDLGGYGTADISSPVLHLDDAGARKAREYRQFGRQLLAALGAWPWTHAIDGRLPQGWHAQDGFIAPLVAWHEGACAETAAELDRCRTAGAAIYTPERPAR